MSGESWLAIKDSSTHQPWVSRPGIQCFLIDLCFVPVLTFHFLFFICGVVVGGGGGAGTWGVWFGLHYLHFDTLFSH